MKKPYDSFFYDILNRLRSNVDLPIHLRLNGTLCSLTTDNLLSPALNQSERTIFEFDRPIISVNIAVIDFVNGQTFFFVNSIGVKSASPHSIT